MTDTIFSLDLPTALNIANKSKCLTFYPCLSNQAFIYASQLRTDYQKKHGVTHCQLVSKSAPLWQNGQAKFHFFEDGSLIYPQNVSEKSARFALENIKEALRLNGYEVKKIYAPQNDFDTMMFDTYMRQIDQTVQIGYVFENDFEIIPLADKKSFVADCFANGCKMIVSENKNDLCSAQKKDIALLTDGRLIIREEYEQRLAAFNARQISDFTLSNPQYVYLHALYVPASYIAELYKKAGEKGAVQKFVSSTDLSNPKEESSAQNEALEYAHQMFQGRTCLTDLYLFDEKSYYVLIPEKDGYALFSDGTLVINKNSMNNILIQDLQRFFPEIDFQIKTVPSVNYIKAIYDILPSYQKSAKEIYLEMMKQKARRLKSMLEITHTDALEIVSKMSGFSSWKAMQQIEKLDAKSAIVNERKNVLFGTSRCRTLNDIVELEYQKYLKNHQR